MAARALARLPLPSGAQWVEALSHPAIMDTTKAKELLGWRPTVALDAGLLQTIDYFRTRR